MYIKKLLKNLRHLFVAAPLTTSSLISCTKDENMLNTQNNKCDVDVLEPYYVSGTFKITNSNTQKLHFVAL